MHSEKSMDLVNNPNQTKTKKEWLPDYLLDNLFFSDFLTTFRNYYYAK